MMDSNGRQPKDYLYNLYKDTVRLGRLIKRHPSQWSIGSWHVHAKVVLFPSLLKDMDGVLGSEVEMS
jgi:hypothetical protein